MADSTTPLTPATGLATIDDTAIGLARLRFGDIGELTLMQNSALEMGRFYAKRHWLGKYYDTDPEVAVTCCELALVRKTQMILLLQKVADVERIAIEEGITYEEASFLAVSRQTHVNVDKELARLSGLGTQRTNQLIILADNMGLAPTTIDDAVAQTVARCLEEAGMIPGTVDITEADILADRD